MNVLIYASYYPYFGYGHIARMAYLYSFLSQQKNWNISYFSNDLRAVKCFADCNDLNIRHTNDIQNTYDAILIDSVYNYLYTDSIPKKELYCWNRLRQKTKKIIAFDYAHYQNDFCDVAINLYNHNIEQLKNFSGRLFSGVEYFIIKAEVASIENKINSFQVYPQILISFGGDDPSNNTLKALNLISADKSHVTVILRSANQLIEQIRVLHKNRVEIQSFSNHFGRSISKHDIIICGGGTTLLEAIYIGNPIIAVAQNLFEETFINYIKEQIPIFGLNDIDMLVDKFNDLEFRLSIRRQYSKFIDGKGKERILSIIQK